MQFMILTYETQDAFDARTDPKRTPGYYAAWTAYGQALRDAAVLVGGAGLEPPQTATTVRVRDGKRLVQDGPFADAKEQLGGYFVVEAPSLDKALEWAAKCPAATDGGVEVRPLITPVARARYEFSAPGK
jgi:hypothetical protein